MYYSYYKTLVEAENILEGFKKVESDNISEYPNVIDATQKYSILPEVRILILLIKYQLGNEDLIRS